NGSRPVAWLPPASPYRCGWLPCCGLTCSGRNRRCDCRRRIACSRWPRPGLRPCRWARPCARNSSLCVLPCVSACPCTCLCHPGAWSFLRRSGAQDDLAAILFLAVEHAITLSGLFKAHPVADDDVRVQLAADDVLQQLRQQRVHVGLTHLEGQALVEGVTEQETVDETGVDAGHTDGTATAHGRDALAQRLADAALQTQVLQHRLGSAALGFEAHRVDHRIHTAATRGLFDDGRCGVVVL